MKTVKCCGAFKCIKGDSNIVMLQDIVILILFAQNLIESPKVVGHSQLFAVTSQLSNSFSLELRNLLSLESFKNNYRNILFKEQQELHHFTV